jgi:hypothetical protein
MGDARTVSTTASHHNTTPVRHRETARTETSEPVNVQSVNHLHDDPKLRARFNEMFGGGSPVHQGSSRKTVFDR